MSRGATPSEDRIRAALERALGVRVRAMRRVSGGDINEARRVDLADGQRIFLKFRAAASPTTFAAEAKGLAWLAEPGALRVPQVLAVGDDPPFLALEWIDSAPAIPDHDAVLGRGLARIHRAGATGFGLSYANDLATLPQDNRPTPDWSTFYASRRLEPLVRRAVDVGLAPTHWPASFSRLYARLPELCGPPELPARLHGDLWRGNVHTDEAGAPCLIDPAVYGGHREVDLAMLALFGAPRTAFFEAYDATWPLAAGWRERVPLWQLYPLLAHVCLFGRSYVDGVERRLRALVRPHAAC